MFKLVHNLHRSQTRAIATASIMSSTPDSEITPFAFGKGTKCPPQKPGTLRLYSMRFCPFAQRTRLVLLYKNIPHETVNIKLNNRPDWFYDINPIAKVPCLAWDGKVVYESATCNDFLDEVFPQNKLNPSQPYLKAKDRQLWESADKLISSFYEVVNPKTNLDPKVHARYWRALNRYEKELVSRGGPYFGGDKVCMVDFMLWPWFERMPVVWKLYPEFTIKPDKLPMLSAWIEKMYELPAVQATMFDEDSHRVFFTSYAMRQWDYDYGLPHDQSMSQAKL